MFFDLSHQNLTLVNYAVDPIIREYDRMVYLALSEFFFDSGMFSYYTAGIFQMDIVNEKVKRGRKDGDQIRGSELPERKTSSLVLFTVTEIVLPTF